MSYFNLNNFSLLSKLGRQEKTVSILLDKNELLSITNGVIQDTADNEIKNILNALLSDQNDIVVISKDDPQNPADSRQNNISCLLTKHMAEMDLHYFDHLTPDAISLKMNSRLNFNEYAHYLKYTDVFISPILYQWVTTRFEKNQNEVIPYIDMDGSLRHLSSDPRLLMQTLFVLASLGSMDITAATTAPVPAATIPVEPDIETQSTSPKMEVPSELAMEKKVSPRSFTPILTKLGLGAFISEGLDSHAGILAINSDEGLSSIDLNDIARSADNIQNLKINNFLLKLFLANKYLETKTTGETSAETVSLIRFRLFEQTKKLPLQLFDMNFAQNTACFFSLTEPNYILKAALYRSAGMDIADFSILSMLRITESSLDKLTTRLSNYTTSEISRSLFGLLILGLVNVSTKEAIRQPNTAQEQKAIDPQLEQQKDILNRIARKLVSL